MIKTFRENSRTFPLFREISTNSFILNVLFEETKLKDKMYEIYPKLKCPLMQRNSKHMRH
jgi:hypothetical protein